MDMTDGAHYPTVQPFTYVRIPCNDAEAVTQCRFDGASEQELRTTLRRCFRQQLLSDEQRARMTRHLLEKAKEKTPQTSNTRTDDTSTALAAAATTAAASTEQQQQQLIEHYLDDASFEIVPVTMPTRATHYVGTSLYIDDSGAFKDLPLNTRASALAQRAIRGDAFLLANHDDPALDEWRRVDCTIDDYDTLRRAASSRERYDTSNTAQMAAATALRESEAKRISEQNARDAAAAKDEGNNVLNSGDVAAAVCLYTKALDLTDGRRDLLADEAAATRTRVLALLNRSLAYNKLHRYDAAAADARAALALLTEGGRSSSCDSTCVKAHYRLATALVGSRDYDAATAAVDAFVRDGGDAAVATGLRTSITTGAQAMRAEDRARFANLFTK